MRIHIAGIPVRIGARHRQRCGWCGEILTDCDLNNIAVPVGMERGPSAWPAQELIAVYGNASWVVDHKDGDEMPPQSCYFEEVTP